MNENACVRATPPPRRTHTRARSTRRDGDHDRGSDDVHREGGATRAEEGDEGTHRHATEEASTERPKPQGGGVPDGGSGDGAGGDDGGVQVNAPKKRDAREAWGALDGGSSAEADELVGCDSSRGTT